MQSNKLLYVLMNFEVSQNLRGCKIIYNGEIFTYTPRFFSMSGELKDSDGNVIAQMKRLSWWHYSFLINLPDKSKYILNRKWARTELMIKNSELKFQTNGTLEFFSKNTVFATKFRHKKHFLCTWSLEVLDHEHWQALLISSCFIHKLDIQSNGS